MRWQRWKRRRRRLPDSLELSFNEALIYDALGKYDEATGILTGLLDAVVASGWQVLGTGEAESRDLPESAGHHLP